MTEVASPPPARKLNGTEWMIVCVAALGFAFDIYELLMLPIIARPALTELLNVDPFSAAGNQLILDWTGYMMWASAISGGVFGLLGGYLTDRFGRKRVLVWSILLYALSPVAAGFATTPLMLLILRCTTFIGVCVEFVAAVAWLAELFPNPRQREAILGYTQAFSSVGGILVTGAYYLANQYGQHLPAIYDEHAPWRYTLMSGMIPAIPLLILQPMLPESQVWLEKKKAGTLQRPSFGALFAPLHRRTAIVTAILFACAYGAAFGSIQLTSQIVPGLVSTTPELKELRAAYNKAKGAAEKIPEETAKAAKLKEAGAILVKVKKLTKAQQDTVAAVNFFQEIGGMLGRFALAFLAVRIVSRRKLLWIFQVPGLLLIPLVFAIPAAGNLGDESLMGLKIGIFIAGFLTVAQFSFWGNYLPRVYPVHIRGLGESFAANVGGRMVGTAASPLTTVLIAPMFAAMGAHAIAYAAAVVAGGVYLIGFVTSFWLPEPSADEDKH